MTDELIRCQNCQFMACKSQYSKTKGYCPVCKAPVVTDMIDHEETLKTWRKANA